MTQLQTIRKSLQIATNDSESKYVNEFFIPKLNDSYLFKILCFLIYRITNEIIVTTNKILMFSLLKVECQIHKSAF